MIGADKRPLGFSEIDSTQLFKSKEVNKNYILYFLQFAVNTVLWHRGITTALYYRIPQQEVLTAYAARQVLERSLVSKNLLHGIKRVLIPNE